MRRRRRPKKKDRRRKCRHLAWSVVLRFKGQRRGVWVFPLSLVSVVVSFFISYKKIQLENAFEKCR